MIVSISVELFLDFGWKFNSTILSRDDDLQIFNPQMYRHHFLPCGEDFFRTFCRVLPRVYHDINNMVIRFLFRSEKDSLRISNFFVRTDALWAIPPEQTLIQKEISKINSISGGITCALDININAIGLVCASGKNKYREGRDRNKKIYCQ